MLLNPSVVEAIGRTPPIRLGAAAARYARPRAGHNSGAFGAYPAEVGPGCTGQFDETASAAPEGVCEASRDFV